MSYPLSMKQAAKMQQSLKQTQRLIMSSQMQQAINLLQLPILELETLIENELEQNPILESDLMGSHQDNEENDLIDETIRLEDENQEIKVNEESYENRELTFEENDFEALQQVDDVFHDYIDDSNFINNTRITTVYDEEKSAFIENSISADITLFDHLMQQVEESFDADEDRKIAEIIIGSIDRIGFLTTPISEIMIQAECSEKKAKEVLKQIQTFDPPGIAAANFQETLLIQLQIQKKNNSLSYQIIEKYFDKLIRNQLPYIAKHLNVAIEEITAAIEETIRNLELHPGANFSSQFLQVIIPDVFIRLENNDSLSVIVNDDYTPGLRLSSRYIRMFNDPSVSKETKEFIRQKIISAKWLMRNLFQRHTTLQRIADFLIRHQGDFFKNIEGQLIPLTMRKIADELQLHESTIVRAVANKYVDSPRGLLPLRSFFSNAYTNLKGEDISSKTVRNVMLNIIDNEDKTKPLSDKALSKELKVRGIPCARRTIAKYRQELNIGNQRQRRKYQ